MLIKTALASLADRKLSVLLCLISITVSLFVLQSVEQITQASRSSFNRSVAGTDLIVGPRTGPINLLLYSVFHLGTPSSNLSWESFEKIEHHPSVDWAVPISLGDSHHGFSVVATTNEYFSVYAEQGKASITFAQGKAPQSAFEAVIGAEVASKLEYEIGDQIILAHGGGEHSFVHHDQFPFTISGILRASGTPKDRSVIISLTAMETIHGQEGHHHAEEHNHEADLAHHDEEIHDHGHEEEHEDHHAEHSESDASHESHADITAVMVGLKSRIEALRLQYETNTNAAEPLLAIIPGVTLTELWQLTGHIEQVLRIIAWLVLVVSLAGMVAMLLASTQLRKQEITVLRVMGARPSFIFLLLECEILLIVISAIVITTGVTWISSLIASDFLLENYGIVLAVDPIGMWSNSHSLIILGLALVCGLLPGLLAYRESSFIFQKK